MTRRRSAHPPRPWVVAALVVLAGCGGGSIGPVSGSTRSPLASAGSAGSTAGLSSEERALLARAPDALATAVCSDVHRPPEYPGGIDRAHIGGPDVAVPPALSSYPSTPPASGPHDPVPLPAGVYVAPPPVYRTIHSLEHAAVIVWVDPTVLNGDPQTEAFSQLANFFSRPDESDHVIVAPYAYPDQGTAGQLPQGVRMALVAWHRLQLCDQVNLPIAFSFVARYRFDPRAPGRYEGEAPETGVPIG